MTLVMYSHLVSVFIVCEFLLLFSIVYFVCTRHFTKEQLVNILKAIIFTSILISFVCPDLKLKCNTSQLDQLV